MEPHFIPIGKIHLPSKRGHQFRRVNDTFVDTLVKELVKEPNGSYSALFVVPRGVASVDQFDAAKIDQYEYEVLGGTHLTLATKKMHEQHPENAYFKGRMANIYVGLNDEQAIYLGAMHQKCTSFSHGVTYREEVCIYIYIYIGWLHYYRKPLIVGTGLMSAKCVDFVGLYLDGLIFGGNWRK